MALAKAEETGLISEKNKRRKSRDGKKRKFTKQAIIKDWKKNKKRYLLALPLIAFFIIFCYLPMGGIVMAFCDYKPKLGIFGQSGRSICGIKKFYRFF